MMNDFRDLSADQRDALQELMNIAMGQAAERLARLIDVMVLLSVPNIMLATDCGEDMAACPDFRAPAAVVTRQSFLGGMRGEVLVSFGADGADELADLMGFDEHSSALDRDELMLDVTNILTGACVNGLAEQLGFETAYAAPSLLARDTRLIDIVGEEFRGSQTLVLEICFKIEAKAFNCELLICVARESIPKVIEAVNRMLESF